MQPGLFNPSAAALNDAVKRGDWPKVESILAPLARKERRDPRPHYQLGMALARQGKAYEALRCFDRALKINPRVPEIHFERGLAAMALDRFGEAKRSFETVLRQAPNDPSVLANLAMIAKLEGKYDDAVERFDALLANPRLPKDQALIVHLNLIETLRNKRDFDRMREEGGKLAKRDPKVRSQIISIYSQGPRGRMPLRPAEI